MRHAPGVDEFRIQVNSARPFNGVEGNPNQSEGIMVLKALKDAEIEHRAHIEHPILAVIEKHRQSMVVAGNHRFD